LKKAFEWNIANLPCFFTDAKEEEKLGPLEYLIRTSANSGDACVITYRSPETGQNISIQIRSHSDSLWQSGKDTPIVGSFAEFIRKVLPPDSVPHNDVARLAQLQRQQSLRGNGRQETVEQRAQSHKGGKAGQARAFDNVLLRDIAPPTSTVFNGVKSNVYQSVSAALQHAKENDENVHEGTVWTGVARTEALAALNHKHDDIDGTSLASETWYFFDLDTFGAGAILSAFVDEPGTFLVRLGSSMTQFVVSFVREGGSIVHILLDVDAKRKTVSTRGAAPYSSVRELVSKIAVLKTPLSRDNYSREFVDCAITLREKPLGLGVGGVVLRGQLNDSIAVAVKRLRPSEDGVTRPTDDAGHISEAEAMLKIRPHPNVNRLYGLVLKPMALVVEFCDRGSLDQILGIDGAPGTKDGEFANYSSAMVLTTSEVWAMARDIARGVAHLHNMRIVHRDLATRNVLVSSPLIPKVADFGMSRLLGEDELVGTTADGRGPLKWQAPEQLHGARVYSFKSDVFSFAVLLTEVVNNQLPWVHLTNKLAAVEVVKGFRTTISSQCAPALRAVIQKCWATDPDARPTMAEVVTILEGPMTVQYESVPPAPASLYDDVDDIN
jgi:serine/threonine protein kinase